MTVTCHVSDEWIIRVNGAEYGPVDLATLIEWKHEGRVLPSNDARPEDTGDWSLAATIPGLFPPPLPIAEQPPPFAQRRTIAEVITDSLRIYRSGFGSFVVLTLLTALPMFALQTIPAAVDLNGQPQPGFMRNAALALAAFVSLVVCWPIFLAGIQIVTSE